jgi:plasmid stabilization system protein ParE
MWADHVLGVIEKEERTKERDGIGCRPVIHRSPFIAVYRVKRKRIEILRILYGAQRWPKVS